MAALIGVGTPPSPKQLSEVAAHSPSRLVEWAWALADLRYLLLQAGDEARVSELAGRMLRLLIAVRQATSSAGDRLVETGAAAYLGSVAASDPAEALELAGLLKQAGGPDLTDAWQDGDHDAPAGLKER